MFGFFRRRAKVEEYGVSATDNSPEIDAEAGVVRWCRNWIGSPPRSLDAKDAADCRLSLTPEVSAIFTKSNDPMLRILADQSKLLDRGQVVWGHLVQANQILFEPSNPHTLAANVIYSLDPYFDGRVGLLARVARGLFAQKGSVPASRELREFVRVITDEKERILRRELPRSYCGGRSVYFTSCFIQPGHLPGNCLTQSAFPLLVNFEETEAVMVLPSRFWPPEFFRQWRV